MNKDTHISAQHKLKQADKPNRTVPKVVQIIYEVGPRDPARMEDTNTIF